jgi:hypothetical protein
MQMRNLLTLAASFALWSASLWCQSSSAPGDQSWKETSNQQSTSGNINPVRTRQSHTESGGRIVDKQTIERRGPDGRYELYLDVERESVKVDAMTVRTVERSYVRGPDGDRKLQQVTQQETRDLAGGEQKIVRSVSNSDANGTFQVVRRQISDSRQISPEVRDTKTTVLSPDLNGGLSPVAQIDERETKTGEHSSQFKKSTLLPDGNGGWQLGEVREGTIQGEAGKNQVRDEKVSRPDGNGKLSVVERTVTKESETAPSEKRDSVEKYVTDIPGTSGDGSLRLAERTITSQSTSLGGGTRTTQQTQQANPGNPSDGMRVTQGAIDIVRPAGSNSTQEKSVTLSLDSKGDLAPVWVDTSRKEIQPAVQVDTRTAPPK